MDATHRYAEESPTVQRARQKALDQFQEQEQRMTPDELNRVKDAAAMTRSHWDAQRQKGVASTKAAESDRIEQMRQAVQASLSQQDPRIRALSKQIGATA